jgi:excisionase family DNA binding protein
MKALHDVKGAAQLLAVSPWTIRAYIRQGKLQPVRLGRLVRLDEEELNKFIAGAKGVGDVATTNQKENKQ